VKRTSIALIGNGVVGARITQRLPLLVHDVELVEVDLRQNSRGLFSCRVAILAHPGPHAELAAELVGRGIAVVSVNDELDDVRAMLELDEVARQNGVPLVVGAGMSPGLTGLLVRHLANQMSACDEIHIAAHGTAGPSCARQHHRALAGRAMGFHDGEWVRPRSGSGRELSWFPEPVGAYDCYHAEVPSPILLHRDFPEIDRLSARVSANRRDRLTARLPMLSRPHREGGVGAVRVEVRGSDADGGRITLILGVAELVGTAAASTAVTFAHAAIEGTVPSGIVRSSDSRLDTIALLGTVERLGVRLQEFTGVPSVRRIAA
jgi:hypothetical protein